MRDLFSGVLILCLCGGRVDSASVTKGRWFVKFARADMPDGINEFRRCGTGLESYLEAAVYLHDIWDAALSIPPRYHSRKRRTGEEFGCVVSGWRYRMPTTESRYTALRGSP